MSSSHHVDDRPEGPDSDTEQPPEQSVEQVKGKGKGKATPARKRRQTRLQEHLKLAKPGSPSPSACSGKASSSDSFVKLPSSTPSPPSFGVELPRSHNQHTTSSSSPSLVSELDIPVHGDVQESFTHDREELVTRLASQGINPHPDVLDRVLRAIGTWEDPGKGITVQTFLNALASLQNPPTSPSSNSAARPPLRSPPHAEHPRVIAPRPTRAVSFGTLESLSSPYANDVPTTLPAFPLSTTAAALPSTPPKRPRPTPSHALSFSGAFPSVLAPSPDIPTSPDRRNSRLHAFGMRRSKSDMVAAEVPGMGRIILARETLVERLGSETAEKAIAAAAGKVSAPTLPSDPPALDAFGFISYPRKHVPSYFATKAPMMDDRLGRVQSWLESSPELADDEADETLSATPKEDEDVPDLEISPETKLPAMISFSSFTNSSPLIEEQEKEIRVGGKSVRLLLRSKRRHIEESDGEERKAVTVDPDVDEAREPPTTPKRSPTKAFPSRMTPPRAMPVFYTEPGFDSAPLSAPPQISFYQKTSDVALAPSPQSSPIRQFPPPSPSLLQITPSSRLSAFDTPHTPTFFQHGRSRMVSGAFDSLTGPSSGPPGVFGTEEPITTFDGDTWHDMTLSPSRSLSRTAYGWAAEAVLDSPTTSTRRRVSSAYPPTTPSQDFLAAMHYPLELNVDSHASDGYAIAQRLFSSPGPPQPTSSPTARGGNRSRITSTSASRWIDAAVSPKLAGQHAFATAPPPSSDAPGMSRSASGLGIGFGQVQLDDVVTYTTQTS